MHHRVVDLMGGWVTRGRYNKMAGMATRLVAKLKELPADDPVRIRVTDQLLDKL